MAQAKYGGGSGTAEAPYLYTAEQMNAIGLNKEDWDKHFRLMADIDLSAYKGSSFNRIGFYDPSGFPPLPPTWRPPFSGTFDGDGHTISGFTYVIDAREPLAHRQWRGDENVGLFGYVKGPAASIRNVTLLDPNIGPAVTCSERIEVVGALVGCLVQGAIEDCHVRGGTVSADGDSWRTIWKYAFTEGELTDSKWKAVTYDIGAVADGQKTVYVRWGNAVLDYGAWVMSGWNIDDISLTGVRE